MQVKYNVIQHVYPELQNLYSALEADFQPLKLSASVAAPLDFIRSKEDLQQYIPALEDTVITRLLKQVPSTTYTWMSHSLYYHWSLELYLMPRDNYHHMFSSWKTVCFYSLSPLEWLFLQVSQVYQTIAFDRFAALAPFADAFRLERVIVNAARTLELQVWTCCALAQIVAL